MSAHNVKVEIASVERVNYTGRITIAAHTRQVGSSAFKTDITVSRDIARQLHAELGEVLDALDEGDRVSAARHGSAY